MERPPSTATTWPVTKGAQARKCTARAMSSGVPVRPSGVLAMMGKKDTTAMLKDYFSDVVLAAGVVVSAGVVTTVQ